MTTENGNTTSYSEAELATLRKLAGPNYDEDLDGPLPEYLAQLNIDVTAALMAPGDDLELDPVTYPATFAGQIQALKIGAVASRFFPFDESQTLADMRRNLAAQKQSCRSSANKSVRTARDRVGGQYAMESQMYVTNSGQVGILATVIRTE